MIPLFFLRIAKVAYAATHRRCWKGIQLKVAPSLEHFGVLKAIDFDLLLDVGANRGQFSLITRCLHPSVPIRAFEPLESEALVYRSLFSSDSRVELLGVGLGESEGSFDMHVSGRTDSSSLLPIGEMQARLFPNTAEVGVRRVEVRRLDGIPEVWQAASKILLKLDVQGFELAVLRGAVSALRHCQWVYVECSHVPLYVGQALYSDVAEFLSAQGFFAVRRHNEQFAGGQLVQADYLFGRSGT